MSINLHPDSDDDGGSEDPPTQLKEEKAKKYESEKEPNAGTAYGEGRGVHGGADVALTDVCVAGESGVGGHCCGARAISETLGFPIHFGFGLGVFGRILDLVIRV
ncbi:hypothetical protein GOBAR_DD09950 [Gossypium barbadense]|nr:hypothetical protein GOBAR_DD09950 [Gossypium barbadense]